MRSLLVLLLFGSQVYGQVSITGEGAVTASPDMATVQVSVVTEADKANKALDANNASMSKLMKSFKDMGIKKEELATNNFSVEPKYKYVKTKDGAQEAVLVGYIVSNHLTVKVCKVEDLGKVLDTAVRDGANRVGSITFGFQNPDKLLDKARELAIADARKRAELYASGAGATLGDVVSIEERDSYMPRYGYAARSAGTASDSAVPVEAGTVTIRTSIRAVWSFKRK